MLWNSSCSCDSHLDRIGTVPAVVVVRSCGRNPHCLRGTGKGLAHSGTPRRVARRQAKAVQMNRSIVSWSSTRQRKHDPLNLLKFILLTNTSQGPLAYRGGNSSSTVPAFAYEPFKSTLENASECAPGRIGPSMASSEQPPGVVKELVYGIHDPGSNSWTDRIFRKLPSSSVPGPRGRERFQSATVQPREHSMNCWIVGPSLRFSNNKEQPALASPKPPSRH